MTVNMNNFPLPIKISDSAISRITDKLLPVEKECQERPLEETYAVVLMDTIHYHVCNEGRISDKIGEIHPFIKNVV